MLPTIFQTPDFAIRTLGPVLAAGFLAAWFFFEKSARERDLPFVVFEHEAPAAILATIVGARFFGILPDAPAIWADPGQIFAIGDGRWSLLGGAVAGLATAGFLLRRRGENLKKWADAAALPALFFAGVLAVGAWLDGQFFYGLASGSPLGVTISDLRHPMSGVRAHPLPLYEIAILVVLAAAVFLVKKSRPGAAALLAGGGFSAGRAALEFFRADRFEISGIPVAAVFWGIFAVTAILIFAKKWTREK